MDTKFYIDRPETVANCNCFISELPLNKKWEVTIKEAKRKRSLPQNSLYWTWLHILSTDTGFSTEDLHNYFKVDILGLKELRHKGKTVAIPNSTRDLSTEEFTAYMDEVQARAASQGITLPYKNFFGYQE